MTCSTAPFDVDQSLHGIHLQSSHLNLCLVAFCVVANRNDGEFTSSSFRFISFQFFFFLAPSREAPYRGGAVGTRLLQHALNEGSADSFIVDAYLHVQTNNDDAIAFYKRFGFVTDQVVPNYYKRLDPPDAVILKLDLKEWKVRPAKKISRVWSSNDARAWRPARRRAGWFLSRVFSRVFSRGIVVAAAELIHVFLYVLAGCRNPGRDVRGWWR